ncbi:MAG TPA: type II secretion system secretin GspD [Casimicrobiaceae bacterium]|nr:type II secretion system secretin GspD [Casimicrobiaceae bacterium]
MSVPRLLAVTFACLLLALPVRAADDAVTLNFVNADIDAVVKAVAEMTGRNFVVDPRVKGVINIVSARPVPRSLVYPTLLAALRLQGFTAVETDGLVKIVPEADAKLQGGPVVRGGSTGGGDRLVTSVYVLKFESASQLVNVLRPLITPNNTIAALPAANALVITDYAENLKRIDKIISSLDVPSAGEPIIVPVRYASAIDLVQVINRLMTEQAAAPGAVADPQQRVVLVADPRSNSILIRGENGPRVARIRSLIEQLDTPGRAGGNIFIIFLKNAEAVRVAQTLRALLSGGSDTSAPSTPLPPASMTTTTGSNAPAASGAPAAAAAALSALSSPSGGGASSAFSAGGVTIQADPANNALIVMAPEPLYNNIRAIVDKLDTRRAQVFVEALIVEVSADRSAEFGIQWQYLQGLSNTSTYVGGNQNFGAPGSGNNIIGTSANLGSAGQGLNLGIIRGSITIPGLGTITNLALLVRALQTDNTANILATPNLLMLDNEESRIIVGQNVPFITGQYAQTGTTATVTPFQTIERQDVGVTLRVKPQITEGGGVRMLVHEEVSSVFDTTNPAGIIINKRSLDSTVLIDDGQIIVLGGLIQDSQTGSTQKIPFLGDIPIAGALFRYDTRVKMKTNLMVFLRPTIMRNSAMGGAMSSDRYDYIIGEQKSIRTDPNIIPPVLPNLQDPQLPPTPLPSSPANPAPMLLPTPSLVPLPWYLPVVPQPTDRPTPEPPK